MANERVKSPQKYKEKDGAPQRLVQLPSLQKGTPKKAKQRQILKLAEQRGESFIPVEDNEGLPIEAGSPLIRAEIRQLKALTFTSPKSGN